MSNDNKGKSFWQTLPGIIAGATGLIIAITGLVTALINSGILTPKDAKPTPFPTSTPIDIDEPLPIPDPATPEPVAQSPPTCTDFTAYEGKANPNAILLAYTDEDLWVQFGGLDESVENMAGLTANIFSATETSSACLRQWVKYLGADHTPHWPSAGDSKGHTYEEVYLHAPSPPVVGELATWTTLPNYLLIAAVDENLNPDFAQVYLCGEDIPADVRERVVYWHAATSEEALADYVELYTANGYTVANTMFCLE